jgi:hypothetical protein
MGNQPEIYSMYVSKPVEDMSLKKIMNDMSRKRPVSIYNSNIIPYSHNVW